jgi:hypothetical protein
VELHPGRAVVLEPPLYALTASSHSVRAPGGAARFSRHDVLEFCAANPHLRATAKVREALRSPTGPPPSRTAGTEVTSEVEALKALARDLRNAAHQNLQAALTAARHAEETARSHREQMEQLTASMAAYDAALTQLTAPSAMND